MKIGILGTTEKAKALGNALTRNGYHVMFGSESVAESNELAGKMERYSQGGTIASTIHYGEIILYTDSFKKVETVFRNIDTFRGKIVVDCGNPFRDEREYELVFGHTSSGAEQIARIIPEASVVKAFNTTFEEHIEQGPYFGSHDATMFYCGDDQEAKKMVSKLIKDIGFDPMDAGPLTSARMLEPMGKLLVHLSQYKEIGREIGYKLLHR